MRKSIVFLSLFFVFLSCKQNASETVDAITMPDKEMVSYDKNADYAVAVVDSVAVESDYAPNAPDENNTITSYRNLEPKIIKTADLRFETDDLDKTYNQVELAIKKYKVTIQNDSEGKNYNSIFKNLILRVPSQNFDAFIKDISKGVSYFDTKEISSDDVTEEFIDVASRIKTKKALENRYLELLKKATKVSEMMEVEKQLSAIREEIEAKEGRLKYLKNRVAMSTVTLNFYKTIAQESGATVSYGTKIGNAIKSGFNGISSFFIWLLEVWPFIIILVALIYLLRKRFKKKIKKENV
jgi:Domain of unknown function (DUF4349)